MDEEILVPLSKEHLPKLRLITFADAFAIVVSILVLIHLDKVIAFYFSSEKSLKFTVSSLMILQITSIVIHQILLMYFVMRCKLVSLFRLKMTFIWWFLIVFYLIILTTVLMAIHHG